MSNVVSLNDYKMRKLDEEAYQANVLIYTVNWPYFYQLIILKAIMLGMFGGRMP